MTTLIDEIPCSQTKYTQWNNYLPLNGYFKKSDISINSTPLISNRIQPKESWIDFSLSLFPDARLFTREEQEQFEAHKKRKFKTIKINF